MTAVKYDIDLYQRLVQSAVFNCEPWRGTTQDLSQSGRAMSYVGTARLGKTGSVQRLRQLASGDGTTSGNETNIVDVTTDFWIEALFAANNPGAACYVLQQGLSTFGGFIFYWSSGAGRVFVIETYDGVAGAARTRTSFAASVPAYSERHVVLHVSPAAGTYWFNGIPSVPTSVNTRAPTNCAPRAIRVMAALGGGCQVGLVRAWQGIPTNDDASCLAAAAQNLCSG